MIKLRSIGVKNANWFFEWCFTILFLFVLTGLIGCEGLSRTKEAGSLTNNNGRFITALWNVQSLFDGEESGNEYDEFRAAAGWNQEKYEARLLSLADAIIRMRSFVELSQEKSAVPDFIGLIELENSRILEDLVQGPLSKQGYTETFFGNLPNMSLGVGVLSRFPLTTTRAHSITIRNETAPRPVLEVHLEPWGEPLIFFICHWKSKVGGEEATESLRRASARIIQRRLRELEQEKPGVPIIIMGDLNENHDEFYRRQGTVITALLPDTMEAVSLLEGGDTLADYLLLSREKPPQAQYFDPTVPILYTPWENELKEGSYYYKNNWETIDHFLLSGGLFNNEGWDFGACTVLNFPPFTNASGSPFSYNPRTGLGLSDHLPLLLHLRTPGQD